LKYKVLAIFAAVAMLAAGCATMPLATKDILEVKITPETGINAGTIITSTVKTTENIEKVYAYITAKQDLKIQFKYDTKKALWTFGYMIPMTMPLPRGDFVVRVEGYTRAGEKQVVERKIKTY
jgi:predicted small secreted protein